MAQEYRLDEVLASLELEDNEVLSSLTRQKGTLESFEHYNNNPNLIIEEILKTDKEKQKSYIKGMISIYPLSAGMLKELMSEIGLQEMREDIFGWLDVSDTLHNMVNKFFTLCSEGIKQTGEESEFEEEIKKLEKQKESLLEQRLQHQENKKKFSEKRQEVERLKEECEDMRKKYSPDILNSEEEKYNKEKQKLEHQKEEFEKKLKEFEKNLEPYKKTGNKDFDKAMEAFSKVIITLP